jgi:tetratricopeptide (TPR) repeat protein
MKSEPTQPAVTKEEVKQKFDEFRKLYQEKKAQGYDVSEAEAQAKLAKQAFDKGNYEAAIERINAAFTILEKATTTKCPPCPPPTPWSECVDNKQTRTNYECSAETNYQCQSYTETRTCEIIPVEVPIEYKDWYNEKESWLDQKITAWKPREYKPLIFGAYHLTASENMFSKTDEETDVKLLEVLEESGVDVISVYPWLTEYEKHRERYDKLFNRIKSDGKKLFIVFRLRPATMSFEEYKEKNLEYTRVIIASVKPDYYGIVIEPTSHGEHKHRFDISNEEWRELVKEVADLSKSVSPNTKTVVAGHKGELDFIKAVADLPNLDIIGFNIYGEEKLEEVAETIDYVEGLGKETWITETWFTLKSNPTFIYSWRQPLDADWTKTMAYFAKQHNMEGVIVFFTMKFVDYFPEDATIEDIKKAFDEGRRTDVFYTYKDVIQEFR